MEDFLKTIENAKNIKKIVFDADNSKWTLMLNDNICINFYSALALLGFIKNNNK